MKKTLTILALTLTNIIANTEISLENSSIQTINTVSKTEIIIREIRTSRLTRENREVRQVRETKDTSADLLRLNREERKSEFIVLNIRKDRTAHYVLSQTNKHFASLK